MSTALHKRHWTPPAGLAGGGAATRVFQGSQGGAEYFLAMDAPAGKSLDEQIRILEQRYEEARQALGLTPDSAVFRRLFVSDATNQMPRIARSRLAGSPEEGPVAVSIIQQPPLTGAKIALQAYHMAGPQPFAKRRISAHHLLVEKNGLGHLWSTRLCGGCEAPPVSAGTQTETVFGELIRALDEHGATLRRNCVRTWIYVKDVDVFYGDMVLSRNRLFDGQGLTAETHFIASTGIEGACAHPFDVVAMDAYSILGMAPEQRSFLNDFSRMCPTHDYNVAFERGTRIGYADRAHHFISGTASIDDKGQVLFQGDVLRQLERALDNVDAILRSGRASLADMASLIVYLRDPGDCQRIQDCLAERLPGVPTTMVLGPVCRPDWLIEVEGIAVTAQDDPTLPRF